MKGFLPVTIFLYSSLLSSSGDPVHPECGSLTLRANEEVKTLVSPYYPDLYPSDLNCPWVITSEPGKTIVLKIDDLWIEDSPNCSSDSLKIYRGDEPHPTKIIDSFCGIGNSKTILTRTSIVLLKFTSDGSTEERGFKLQYHAGEEEGCHKELNDLSGVTTSPRYPSNYPDYTDCTTLIRLPQGERVYLTFQDLTLEYEEGCGSDFVEVFDGPNNRSKSLGRFCRPSNSLSLQSSSNQLFVAFHSDSLVTAKGFKALYSSEGFQGIEGLLGRCAWDRSELNGTLASPGYPGNFPSSSDCRIQLKGPKGSKIAVHLEDFDIPDCIQSFLELREPRRKPIVSTLCGNLTSLRRRTFFTRRNELTISFKSSDSSNLRTGRGFLATYFFLEDDVGKIHLPRGKLSLGENSVEYFEQFPGTATVKKGERHVLTCKPKSGFPRWLKDFVPVEAAHVSSFERMVLNENSIVISSMSSEKAGIYTCLAYIKEGIFAVHAWISMQRIQECSPVLIPYPPPEEIQIFEKERIAIKCLPKNNQQVIGWKKNGREHEITGGLGTGQLDISSAALEDSGIYECWTSGGDGCLESYSVKVTVQQKPIVCGQPKIAPNVMKPTIDQSNRIVGGREAIRGSYPWQVALYYRKLTLFCGGSLLNELWIVTAAHCYADEGYQAEETEARLGKNNVNTQEHGQVVAQIQTLIVHHQYNKRVRLDHDIALLKLSNNVIYTEFIAPICLEMPSVLNNVVFKEGTFHPGTVTGWGRLAEGGDQPAVLHEIVLPIQSRSKCIGSTNAHVSDAMFCAGYDVEVIGAHLKADACEGDSGGPFIVRVNGRWILVGVVSWGEGCARRGKYGFYTKVDEHFEWINNFTSKND